MANKNLQKLELTWIGKGEEPKLEPRILIENPEYSYGDPDTGNMLIHGDNLLALKALEQDYAGKIKCIYIDPPYNTGQAFEYYDDGIEHSIWLNLMYLRLKILYKLLKKDGVIFINLDENEQAYCKLICDEIFGRENYIGDLIWQKRKGGGNDSRFFAIDHDYVLVYAKFKSKEIHSKWKVSQSEEYLKRYKEKDENGRFYWDTLARDGLQNPIPIEIDCPDGTILRMNSQKSKDTILTGLENGTVRLSQGRNGWSLHHKVYMPSGQVLRSILTDVGTNKTAGDEIKSIFGNAKSFDYPKPEGLISKILELTTVEGDIVLDSFLGSGTTAAVAHKMGRKYIGVELGEHAKTHCYPRLKAVVDGEQGGISKAVNWQGGGGFKFYTLAPSLLQKDKFDNWVISENYNADMLAAAMAKQEGFKYQPDDTKFWKQGRSSEQDFIYTTTQFLTAESLESIHDDMLPGESLLICCKAFQKECKNRFPNISVKKIPQMLLNRCEFGKDDYSFNIVNLPTEETAEETEEPEITIQELNDQSNTDTQTTLFD
ncbi:Modification methylase MboII [Chryseobacterium taklimakanense]|uniref:site-specific DNA-methyltransferase (adenine-specific) n=1 Tax=Chryseobacterium taklimakanense TaxID=536441 RepID=A0A239WDG5_9FLAO|nr:site-specific DNA-methyltransferase [Chryseobacterium taklimakanense]SNV31953.1 Modification methylase MboII [Chryseobacterium taklimakanense]